MAFFVIGIFKKNSFKNAVFYNETVKLLYTYINYMKIFFNVSISVKKLLALEKYGTLYSNHKGTRYRCHFSQKTNFTLITSYSIFFSFN